MKNRHSILIVEDEAPIRDLIKKILKKGNYAINEAKTVVTAKRQLKKKKFDLILLDLTLPDGSGLDILDKISVEYRNRVIIVSGTGTIDTAVEAMRKGAYDFLKKPVNHNVLLVTLKKALDVNRELDDFRILKYKLSDQSRIEEIVYRSRNMAEVVKKASECAQSSKTILITGETGTGKELIARAIHNASARRKNPFITVNCSTIPLNLAESELFGFDKGAFTGADRAYPGKFSLASKGTIFLDEIGDLHPEIQPKLLRVLESGEIFPLKSTWPKNLDIRVIAATNMDLKEEREGHQFRRDLYFRLQQVEINIPPLRERKDDIIPLVEHFISINNITFSKQVKEVDEQAQELLLRYQWPGNVRELKNTIEEIMAFISGTKINIEHLPSRLLEDQKFALPENSVMTLQDLEKKYIRRILALTGYNIQKTAKLLGIGRPSLYRKMEKYKLEKMK
jgi:two-component system response regulator AtoC